MRGLFRKNANLEDENGSFKDCKWEKTTMDISSTITELSANPKGIKFARLGSVDISRHSGESRNPGALESRHRSHSGYSGFRLSPE